MALLPSSRQLKHTRRITVDAYAREDGLWDIEGRVTDHKTRPVSLASGVRAVGDAVHDMTVRLTIDTQFNVLDASATSDAVPYPGFCEAITPEYSLLKGLNLMKGFRQAVRERFGGVSGCTHITELCGVLPTAAVQAFAGEVFPTRDGGARTPEEGSTKPFQLDRCHALRTDGDAVRQYYPVWFKSGPAPGKSE